MRLLWLGNRLVKNQNKKTLEENIQKKTIKILERTFLDCLKHFRGSQYYEELAGLEKEYTNVTKEQIKEVLDSYRKIINLN